MLARFHHAKDLSEDSEVGLLDCLKMVLLEESDDLHQVGKPPYSQLHPSVVVYHDGSCSEELLYSLEGGFVAFVLNDSEFWQNLPAGRHLWLLVYGDTETAFTFRETNHPVWR